MRSVERLCLLRLLLSYVQTCGCGRHAMIAALCPIKSPMRSPGRAVLLFVYSKSPWEDTEVPRKHHMLLQHLKRQRWMPDKEYESMVDIVMDPATFRAYIGSHMDAEVLRHAKRELPGNRSMWRESN